MKKKSIKEILKDEMKEVKNMEPDEEEDGLSFTVRKQHYLAEIKAIQARIFIES